MAATNGLMVLECSRVAPAATSNIGNHTFPLSFLDIPWICFDPVHQLCFYDYPHSTSHFNQIFVPNLKHSLSLTLQHFFPYSGNMIVFPSTNSSTRKKPEIRYQDGDSVSLLVAECRKDFNHLTGNHARKADEFYPLVPRLGEVVKEGDLVKVPLLAAQVTLFPGRGICIGVTTHHVACDGNARVRFLQAWALIAKLGDDKSFSASGSLPFLDRSVLKDPRCLGEIFWKHVSENRKLDSRPAHISGPTDKVRVSFMITRTQIKRFKKLVPAQRPALALVSSYVVVCGHVWTCLAKMHATTEDQEKGNGDDELEGLICPADARARLDPLIPATYFGNCLVGAIIFAKRVQLIGEEGFLNAVELIREAIYKRFRSKESIFEGLETWMTATSFEAAVVGIAGSPKFNIYETDFGLGKPRKCEAVSIDYAGSVSLSASRDSQDDMEISLSLPKFQMDVFATIFDDGLKNIECEN